MDLTWMMFGVVGVMLLLAFLVSILFPGKQ